MSERGQVCFTCSHPSLSTALLMTSGLRYSISLLQDKAVWPSASASGLLQYYRAQEIAQSMNRCLRYLKGCSTETQKISS